MLKSIIGFISDVINKRRVIYELAKRDFKQQYQGSYLGFIWMFLQPIMYVSVLYAVFSLGFKAEASVNDMPFSLYLIAGMVAWLYFSSNLSAICGVIKNHAFLVKKVDFRLSVLPFVKLLSSLVPHLALVVLTIALAWYQGYSPSFYTLQVLYYTFSMCVLLLGIGWITSSTSIFVKDITKVVALVVQFGFWLTPLFWNIQMIPQVYQWLAKLNPVYYIVTGYRDSIIAHVPFWQRVDEAIYFWVVTLSLLLLGILLFRKLKPHFAEVI